MTTETVENPTVADAAPVLLADAEPATFSTIPQGENHVASNADMLDNAAPQTEASVTLKQAIIARLKSALATVKGMALQRAVKQADVVGILAELLPLYPSNKELAQAMTEPYDAGYHGPAVVTEIRYTKTSGHDPERTQPATNPNPYAQSVRRYKLLAQVECGLPMATWDADTFKAIRDKGVLINGVQYASPVAALLSGQVSMEAVFQTYANVLQPRVTNLADWSKDQVAEAQKFAPKIRITVRHFDRKTKRDQKISVNASESVGALFGTITGLLMTAHANEVVIGQVQADQIIAAVNLLVVTQEQTT